MDTALLAPLKIQDKVKETYAEAAETSKPGLCCPKPMPRDYVSHIPAQAFEHSYGCGSPILNAGVKPGETVVDLGCGVGIDCFVAAKLVGPTGRVIGVDMTDEMLAKAYSFNADVNRNLGYEVVEFRKGKIEQLPLPDSSVDLLVSNCVLNLSTDKEQVFKEIFRVLRHGGRMVISDIVADRDIKPEDRQDAAAWADCTLGTLSLRQFLESISQTGFIGLAQLDEKMWQEIKGYHLSSLTLQAHKFETDCHATLDHLAIYLGPFAEVSDDLGNSYKRFKPTAIRGDVAKFLQKGASESSFIVVAGRQAAAPRKAQAPAKASPCCDPGDKVTPCCDNNEPKEDGSPCCDPLAAQQPPDCPCTATAAAPAPEPVAAQASSGCCDSGSGSGGGCGPGSSGCGPSASAPSIAQASASSITVEIDPTATEECCPCETEAQTTGSECCGEGCGTCGCS